jgi:hypothetical protein
MSDSNPNYVWTATGKLQQEMNDNTLKLLTKNEMSTNKCVELGTILVHRKLNRTRFILFENDAKSITDMSLTRLKSESEWTAMIKLIEDKMKPENLPDDYFLLVYNFNQPEALPPKPKKCITMIGVESDTTILQQIKEGTITCMSHDDNESYLYKPVITVSTRK